MNVRLAAAVALLGLTLAGCSGSLTSAPTSAESAPAGPSVSTECTTSLDALATVDPGDFEAEDAAIVVSLSACSTADEYLEGVRANPASWALTGPEFVKGENIFPAACALEGAAETPVCIDAKTAGYVE